MCNGQPFQVCVITRVQVGRLFHARQRHRVVIQLSIIGSLCIVHLCRLRIDGLAVLQQIEGCRELPLVLQVLSLEEEVFQSLGIIERERGSRSVECGMWSVEYGVRCATTFCGHTRSHDHGNRGHHHTSPYRSCIFQFFNPTSLRYDRIRQHLVLSRQALPQPRSHLAHAWQSPSGQCARHR